MPCLSARWVESSGSNGVRRDFQACPSSVQVFIFLPFCHHRRPLATGDAVHFPFSSLAIHKEPVRETPRAGSPITGWDACPARATTILPINRPRFKFRIG